MGDLKYKELTEWAWRLPQSSFDQSPFRPVQMSLGFNVGTLEALCNMPAGLLVEMNEPEGKGFSILDDDRPDYAEVIDRFSKTNDLVHYGITSLYAHVITYTWSTFETLAGDLWETAVNTHPKILADLRGIRGRIERGDSQQKKGEADKKKTVPLEAIKNVTKGTFELQGKVGTLLREQSELFTRLSGIREAYSAAFSEDFDSIDEILKSESLEILSAVRNAIVHKAGAADAEYVEFCKNHPAAPQAQAGELLGLDGLITANLAEPVIAACVKLLTAVVEWVERNQ